MAWGRRQKYVDDSSVRIKMQAPSAYPAQVPAQAWPTTRPTSQALRIAAAHRLQEVLNGPGGRRPSRP